MTEYNAPVKDMKFALRELSSLDEILNLPAFADIDDETVDQVLEEADLQRMYWRH